MLYCDDFWHIDAHDYMRISYRLPVWQSL